MKAHVLCDTKELSREEWLARRRQGIGGSDAAAILGVSPWASAFDVWLEKTGEYSGGPDPDSEVMYWGTVLEDLVAREFSRRTGKKVRKRNAILCHPEHEWMLANVDRLVVGEEAGLECKTTSAYNQSQWDDKIPPGYYAQVQHYMAVTGFDTWYLAVLIGGQKYKDFVVGRDPEYIENLIQAEMEFWRKVERGEPPEMDGSAACSQVLARLYPEAKEDEQELSPEAFSLVSQYEEAQEEEKAAQIRKDEAANKLKELLQEHERGRIYDRVVSWSNVITRRLDTKTFQSEEPDLYERYLRESKYRKFSIR